MQQEGEEQYHIERVQEHVAQVVAGGALETEETGVEQPGEVAHDQRLLAREVANQDLAHRGGQRRLVVEVGMPEQHLPPRDPKKGEVKADEAKAE